MMKMYFLGLIAINILSSPIDAMDMNGRPGNGLIGYGINMYKPFCASACHDSIPMKMHCEEEGGGGGGGGGGMDSMTMSDGEDSMPSAKCISTNVPFLQSLAYCIDQHCPTQILGTEMLNHWWKNDMIGRKLDQPKPIMTFEQALQSVKGTTPTSSLSSNGTLESAIAVNETTFLSNYNAAISFQSAEEAHSTTSLALIFFGVFGPTLLSLIKRQITLLLEKVGVVPWQIPKYRSKIPLIGARKMERITNGQLLGVIFVWIMNIILSSVGYKSYQPNAWFASTRLEILTYVTNRTGVLSFVNIVLLILYSGRNNPLLLISSLSRSTYLLLHKQVAIIATIQACLHSAIYLQMKLANGTLSIEQVSPYWIMGIVATLAMVILLPLSIRPIRNATYEIFLIVHILFAIVTLIGCWYHIILRFQHQWGYETWLYISFAVWSAERAFRIVRLLLYSGWEKAIIVALDQDYLKISIPRAQQSPFEGGLVYLYFPTLSWRPWENHPFSVAGPAMDWKTSIKSMDTQDSTPASPNLLEKDINRLAKIDNDGGEPKWKDDWKSHANVETEMWPVSEPVSVNGGVTFFVRIRNGITERLAEKTKSIHNDQTTKSFTLPVLLEGAYDRNHIGQHSIQGIFSNKPHKALPLSRSNQFSKIICIAGGVGITALIPILHNAARAHIGQNSNLPSVSLHWASRSLALVKSISSMINISMKTDWSNDVQRGNIGMLSTNFTIGHRLDSNEILEGEMRGARTNEKPILILVCAPLKMAEAYRDGVTRYLQLGYKLEYHEECFSW